MVFVAFFESASMAEAYRGIEVAPERRCEPYDRAQYRYSQSLEPKIIASMSRVYGPYTGRCFGGNRETDIEHMVAISEAHDSGLCAAPASAKVAFASDLLNLTLAHADLNRYRKRSKDVAEWTPPLNACWMVTATLEVRRKYGLTIDRAEADAAERVLAKCDSTEMVYVQCRTVPRPPGAVGRTVQSLRSYGTTAGRAESLLEWREDRSP